MGLSRSRASRIILVAVVIDAEVFAGSVAMCILTIIVVPPILKPLGKKYQMALAEESG